MSHVFISYVRDDQEIVDRLCAELRSHGIEIWLDRDSIKPGLRWRSAIRKGITEGAFFIACFSRSYNERNRTYMNEEITAAIDELRTHSTDTAWFIPVLITEASVPDLEIGAGATLRDIQQVELYKNWNDGMRRIIQTISPTGKQFSARRYRIGDVQADVYMDLLGGGDQYFDRNNLKFEYKHEWASLPEPIERGRKTRIENMEREAKEKGQIFFNGPAIRLQSFDLNVIQSTNGKEEKQPILYLRPTCWHDFALANRDINEKILVGKDYKTIKEEYADENNLVSSRNVDWIQLTNILTISIVMVTRDNWTLLGRRTKRVDNASDVFTASAAENIHRWKDEPSDPDNPWSLPKGLADDGVNVTWDYKPSACPNPFFTVLRGIREEVAEEVAKAATVDDVKFLSLAWNFANFQPHLYGFLKIDMRKDEIEKILSASRGDDNWEANLVPVAFEPSGQLKNYLKNQKWAEVSKGAILRSLVHVHGYEEVNKGLS